MNDIKDKQYKKMLCKDECGDLFLLLKYGEVYEFSSTEYKVVMWGYKVARVLDKLGIVTDRDSTDDGLTIYTFNREDLDKVVSLGFRKEKIQFKSNKIKQLEDVLAHRILPLNAKEGITND